MAEKKKPITVDELWNFERVGGQLFFKTWIS